VSNSQSGNEASFTPSSGPLPDSSLVLFCLIDWQWASKSFSVEKKRMLLEQVSSESSSVELMRLLSCWRNQLLYSSNPPCRCISCKTLTKISLLGAHTSIFADSRGTAFELAEPPPAGGGLWIFDIQMSTLVLIIAPGK